MLLSLFVAVCLCSSVFLSVFFSFSLPLSRSLSMCLFSYLCLNVHVFFVCDLFVFSIGFMCLPVYVVCLLAYWIRYCLIMSSDVHVCDYLLRYFWLILHYVLIVVCMPAFPYVF